MAIIIVNQWSQLRLERWLPDFALSLSEAKMVEIEASLVWTKHTCFLRGAVTKAKA